MCSLKVANATRGWNQSNLLKRRQHQSDWNRNFLSADSVFRYRIVHCYRLRRFYKMKHNLSAMWRMNQVISSRHVSFSKDRVVIVRSTDVYLMMRNKVWSPTEDVFKLIFPRIKSIFSQSTYCLISISTNSTKLCTCQKGYRRRKRKW